MDYTTLITSEHNQRPNFVALVNLLANGVGAVTAVIQSIPGVFDLANAVGVQQDVLGEWIGVSRNVAGILTVKYFGFSDDPAALPFGEIGQPSIGGVFYNIGDPISSSASLSDPNYALVLQAKVLTNQFDGAIQTLEDAYAVLTGLLPQIVDPGIRVVTLIPAAAINAVMQQLLNSFDILPRPGGTQYVHLFPMATSSLAWATAGAGYASGSTVGKY